MLRKVLQEVGLHSKEAELYLACIRLGTQDIKTLSKEIKLPAVDVSIMLSNLLDKGFVSKYSRGKDFFTPEQPAVLLKIIENNHIRTEESIAKFKKHLPQFEKYMNPAFTKPEIAFYEGREGIVAAYEDTLTSKTEILAWTSLDDTESTYTEYVPKYYKRRAAANIPIRAIFVHSKRALKRQKNDAAELRTSRLLPKDLLNIEIEVNIYDDKIAYFSIPEKLAVIVKSKLIADTMRSVFELSWRMAELYQSRPQTFSPVRGSQKKKIKA